MITTRTTGRTTYRAVRLHGTGTGGVRDFLPGELAGWVGDRFEAGWRRLVVTDCTTGEQIGWIGRDPATGHRTWSATDPWPIPPSTTTDIGG